jgi:hypothetical protein
VYHVCKDMRYEISFLPTVAVATSTKLPDSFEFCHCISEDVRASNHHCLVSLFPRHACLSHSPVELVLLVEETAARIIFPCARGHVLDIFPINAPIYIHLP